MIHCLSRKQRCLCADVSKFTFISNHSFPNFNAILPSETAVINSLPSFPAIHFPNTAPSYQQRRSGFLASISRHSFPNFCAYQKWRSSIPCLHFQSFIFQHWRPPPYKKRWSRIPCLHFQPFISQVLRPTSLAEMAVINSLPSFTVIHFPPFIMQLYDWVPEFTSTNCIRRFLQ